MKDTLSKYGIVGYQAPDLNVSVWVDPAGKLSGQYKLEDYNSKFKVLYCFQAWCPGCHSRGLPALQKIVEATKDNDKVAFLAIQTVFEGFESNTLKRMEEIQKEYNLMIPFGHDVGSEDTHNISSIMYHYRTGGTPWFIFIDQNNLVVFNDFHLNEDKAIEFLKGIK